MVPLTDVVHLVPGTNPVGVGDILQSFFLSPAQPVNEIVIGAGPMFLYPTATRDEISANQFAAGPTLVALKQQNGFTIGILANHLWGVGNPDRNDLGGGQFLATTARQSSGSGQSACVNASYLQPFFSYTTPKQTTFTLQTKSTYNWTAHHGQRPSRGTSVRCSRSEASPSALRPWRILGRTPRRRASVGRAVRADIPVSKVRAIFFDRAQKRLSFSQIVMLISRHRSPVELRALPALKLLDGCARIEGELGRVDPQLTCSPGLRSSAFDAGQREVPSLWRVGELLHPQFVACAHKVEHVLGRKHRHHLAALLTRIGIEVEERGSGQAGLFADPNALVAARHGRSQNRSPVYEDKVAPAERVALEEKRGLVDPVDDGRRSKYLAEFGELPVKLPVLDLPLFTVLGVEDAILGVVDDRLGVLCARGLKREQRADRQRRRKAQLFPQSFLIVAVLVDPPRFGDVRLSTAPLPEKISIS